MISSKITRQGLVYNIGLVLTMLSLIAHLMQITTTNEEVNSLYFMFCYGMVIAYMLVRWIMKNEVEPDSKIFQRTWLWLIFLISCYSLNEEIRLFAPSVTWFKVVLSLVLANLLLYAYWNHLAGWVQNAVSFVNGTGLLVFSYLTIYLIPAYLIGAVALPVLGVSFHVFVPLCLLIHAYRLQRTVGGLTGRPFYYYLSGMLLAAAICAFFSVRWAYAVHGVNNSIAQGRLAKTDVGVPVAIAQYLEPSALNLEVLHQAPINNKTRNRGFSALEFNLFGEGDREGAVHDPIALITQLVSGRLNLTEEERQQVIYVLTDSRHENTEHLWRDRDLQTISVDTRIDVWPDCFMAYTEKLIKVGTPEATRMIGPQEAIYTFYLPQGAVVTSLSLWVNGVEEKGIMTTREKAGKAYQQIVGAERRDPAIVQWQEGNTVLVRVFPVSKDLPRQFKIGITSLLALQAGRAAYAPIWFKGPDWENAVETIHTQVHEPVGGFEISKEFISHAAQVYERKGVCNPSFTLAFNANLSRNCTYTYQDHTYQMRPYSEELEKVQWRRIYLDVNATWSRKDFDALVSLSDQFDLYVWDNEMKKLDRSNAGSIWKSASGKQISLFPFYKVETAGQSLVVTSNGDGFLDLGLLKNTEFYNKTRDYFNQSEPVRIFNLGKNLLPYQQSLLEYRRLQYDEGSLSVLLNRIQTGQFPRAVENDDLVVIPQSGLSIYRLPKSGSSGGSDHVLRLFAYNAVMRASGKGLKTDLPESDAIVEQARRSNVVTPLTSLVVLETSKDYERFNIREVEDGLGNAALQGKGAVPEPHEWALMAIAAVFIGYYMIQRKRKTAVTCA